MKKWKQKFFENEFSSTFSIFLLLKIVFEKKLPSFDLNNFSAFFAPKAVFECAASKQN